MGPIVAQPHVAHVLLLEYSSYSPRPMLALPEAAMIAAEE
jgi:hypothetical protein